MNINDKVSILRFDGKTYCWFTGINTTIAMGMINYIELDGYRIIPINQIVEIRVHNDNNPDLNIERGVYKKAGIKGDF